MMRIPAFRSERHIVFLRSAAAGALIMRGAPMAAVSAGWELSAEVGVRAGEILSLIIFLLGSSGAAVALELPGKIFRGGTVTAAAIVFALCAAGEDKNTFLVVADCVVVCASLFINETGRRKIICTVVLSAAAAFISGIGAGSVLKGTLVPLSASLIIGRAAVFLTGEDEKSVYGLLSGAAAIMLLDLFG